MKMDPTFAPLTEPNVPHIGGVFDVERLSSVREQASARRRGPIFSYALVSVLVDLVAFVVSFLAWYESTKPLLGSVSMSIYAIGTLLMSILPIMIIGGYSVKTELCSARFLSEHVIASGISTLFVLAFISLVMVFDMDARLAGLYGHGVLVGFSVLGVSVFSKRYLERRRVAEDGQKFVYVFGANARARELYQLHRKKKDPRRMRVFDFDLSKYGKLLVEGSKNSPIVEHVPSNEFPPIGGDVDTIVIASEIEDLPVGFLNHLMAVNLIDYKVETARKFISSEHKKVSLDGLNSSWFFEGGFRLLENTVYYRTKCVIDFVLSAFALLFLSPLMLAVGLAVKLTSKGPVFFTQQRVGVGGESFKLYKFRTMKVGSEKGHLYTLENDPRITSIGNFLRSTRLDELPQLFNVLKGEMSLVGPRAEWTRCVEGYEASIPFYHYRHLVKPGITGWAQVNYPYGENERDTIEKLKFDLYYVRHFSLTLDFSIFVKTIYVMLGKHGSR